jgi:hypothetical protein
MIYLVISRFNIDEGGLAEILRAEARQYLTLIDFIASPGDLITTIERYLGHETCPLAQDTKSSSPSHSTTPS